MLDSVVQEVGQLFDKLMRIVVQSVQILRQNQISGVHILRVEFIDPFSDTARLLEQELLPLLFGRLVLRLHRYALLEDFYQENRHVGDLLVHDIYTLHLHVCVILVCLRLFELVHLLLAGF